MSWLVTCFACSAQILSSCHTLEALLCRQRRKMSNPRSEPKIYATLDSLCSKVGMLLAGRHQTVMCSLALTASMPAGVEQ